MKSEKEIQLEKDQQERIRLGSIAHEGLESPFWIEIIKPTIDSMLRGINDIASINLTSEKKASIELAGRLLATKYIAELETLIRGFVIDADTTLVAVEKKKKTLPLYKIKE